MRKLTWRWSPAAIIDILLLVSRLLRLRRQLPRQPSCNSLQARVVVAAQKGEPSDVQSVWIVDSRLPRFALLQLEGCGLGEGERTFQPRSNVRVTQRAMMHNEGEECSENLCQISQVIGDLFTSQADRTAQVPAVSWIRGNELTTRPLPRAARTPGVL